MPPPELGTPAWHPDPSGRHQYRWFDGARFTEQVADGEVVTTDADAAATVQAPPPRRRARWQLVVLAAVVVVGAAAAALVLLTDDDDGAGSFDGSASPSELGTHDVAIGAGQALAVEVEPGDELDAVVALVVADDDAERLAEVYEDVDLVEPVELADAFGALDAAALEQFGDDDVVILRTDVGFAGEEEVLVLPTPIALDAQVVVAPFGDEDDDDYGITIVITDLGAGDDPDAEELLEATAESDEVPRRARDVVEELLAE